MLYDITYMRNLKYDTIKVIYEVEIDKQAQRTDLQMTTEKEGHGGWTGSGGGRCKLLHIEQKTDKQQGPNAQHGELYSGTWDKPQWKII